MIKLCTKLASIYNCTVHGTLSTPRHRQLVMVLLYIVQGVSKKPARKSFSHYFFIYGWKSMKLQENFGYTIVNNILKSQKLSIILLGFIGLAPNDHLNPNILSSAQRNSTITLLQTDLGLALISNANLYLRNVVGFVGKHHIFEITPEEESWGPKFGL